MDTISLYKHRIDALMDILFGAGVSNPQTIIEQLNYLLFLRALSIKDDEAELLGITDEGEKVFAGDLAKYRWQNLLALNAEDLFKTLETSFDLLQKKSKNPTVKLLFRNAHIKIFDKPTLRRVLHEIETFAKELDAIAHEGNKDVFGDMYEYLLSKLSSAGTNGQFRTPRHIIDFMVKVVDPKKNETILDPACGTAGFLVATYRHIAGEYTSDKLKKAGSPRAMDKLSADEKKFLFNHMFTGFDSDEDMIKFGMMNLHLHGLTKSRLARQNSLTDTSGMKDKFDVILANPPFAGKIDEESVSEDLRMGTKATELLFLRFMMDHLSLKGKLAVIVPEGVVFNTSKAHTKIRQMLIEKGLWAVVSLPSGAFNPYSGVKTSLLFIDKEIAKIKDELLFIKIGNDGFDLGAQRRPSEKNDLPIALEVLNGWKNNKKVENNLVTSVPKSVILKGNDISLSADRYRSANNPENNEWPIVTLGEIIKLDFGERITKKNKSGTKYPVYGGGGESFRTDAFNRENEYVIARFAMSSNCVRYVDGPFWMMDSGGTFSIKPDYKTTVLKSYIGKVLEYKQNDIYMCARGGAQKNLNNEYFYEIKIPLPSIKVQEQIIDELNTYQKVIDGAKQVVENWKPTIEIAPSWKMVKLGDICEPEYGFTDTAKDRGDARFIRITDISSFGELIQENKKFIKLSSDAKKYLLHNGDLLVARTGATFGKTLLFNEDEPSVFASFLIRLNFSKEEILPEYYWAFAQSEMYWRQANGLMTGGGQPQFNGGALKQIEIPLPSLGEQSKIVDQINEERKMIQGSKQIIPVFEQKIKDRLAKLWS